MQIYQYKCDVCQTIIGVARKAGEGGDFFGPCDQPDYTRDMDGVEGGICPGEFRRVFAVNVNRPMQEHFNKYVNQPISDMRQFSDVLKAKSESEEARTGIPCRYAPVDTRELIKPVAPREPAKVVKAEAKVVGGFGGTMKPTPTMVPGL